MRTSAPRTGAPVPGATLTPSRAGAFAALGMAEATVYARPRAAILSTGNEIIEPGQPLAPGLGRGGVARCPPIPIDAPMRSRRMVGRSDN